MLLCRVRKSTTEKVVVWSCFVLFWWRSQKGCRCLFVALPGVARRLGTFFCFAKRKYPKKRRPRFAAPYGGSLCCSQAKAAPELVARMGFDTNGSVCARHSNILADPSLRLLRCSADSHGAQGQKPILSARSRGGEETATPRAPNHHALAKQELSMMWVPMRVVEQRSEGGGKSARMSEWRARTKASCASPSTSHEFRSRPVLASSAEQPEGPTTLGSPSFGYFSWRSKKSDLPPGNPRHLPDCANG